MVVGNQDTGGTNSVTHPSGIPQDKIDNIMSGIANTGDVKMNNHRKKLRQRFDIIKKLGQGTYGKVQLGINKETGQEVAIKTIKKCKIEAESDLVRIRREVQIMSSVQHPNIIHIYEVFENREKMVLVMEFAAGGELYDYLSERKVLSEEEARRIFRQVSTAVYYCHKHKICHRDLKLENILLDEHGNAKIADFGLSNVFDDQRMLATFCGSPLYASPEIVEGTPYHGPEVDCWSLGVLLYTLVYGSMPFDGSNFKRLVKQISQGDYYEPKKPSRASSLIREMLTVCPRKRATIEQICSHWWVNENDNVSCLELAEDLANQTPVRLDVLLSLTPAAITADQLVVPSADGGGTSGKSGAIPRSHSVGSIRDMGPNTEAERRILDMVAAGGEAALMPSPTRTITPAQSPIQTKRKLENTVSTENATGVALNKKEKPGSTHALLNEPASISTVVEEPMPMDTDTEDVLSKEQLPNSKTNASRNFSVKDMKAVGDLCEQLIQDNTLGVPTTDNISSEKEKTDLSRQLTVTKLDTIEDVPEKTKGATKVIKKFVNKHKTADLVNVIGKIDSEESAKTTETAVGKTKISAETTSSGSPAVTKPFVRKCSLQDETPLSKFNTERRKSRILETAEKFQQMNANNNNAAIDKPKKLVIPGVSVGNFKKEYERKASTTGQQLTAGEQRALEEVAAAAAVTEAVVASKGDPELSMVSEEARVEASDSKASVSSFSLEDARRSMENSIALIRQAQSESSKDVNSICAKTENICVSEREPKILVAATEREQKLKNARAIIGNAIQPVLRRPQTPLACSSYFGNGGGGYDQMRANSGSYIGFGSSSRAADPPIRKQPPLLGSSTLPANANAALAAARQTLMGRLAAGGIGSIPYANTPSPRLGNEEQTKSLHSMHVPSYASSSTSSSSLQLPSFTQHPLLAPSFGSAATASTANPNAKAVSNKTTTNTSTFTNSNVINTNSTPKPFYNASPPPLWKTSATPVAGDSVSNAPPAGTMKTSTASITLKSATLPRRKTAKSEIQLDIKAPIAEKGGMRFTTEMQHPVADLRSAPPREGPVPYSPIKSIASARASSLEPKEHIIHIQKPPSTYMRTTSNTTTRSDSLSRQSTNDSESDTTTTNMSQSTIAGSSQPIKKSPREFIIPIAVEGGGFITPREGSIEPSESGIGSSRSTFTRLRPTRRIGSLLSETGVDDSSPFQKLRTSSSNRDGDDDSRFTLHKLRSSRPVKKVSQDNDSQSSGEEDDDDGFEILTAENLFSTLLQRVRALTNRMNVNNDITSGFPSSSRILSNMRQAQSPFWNQDPFGRSKVSYTYSETIEKKQVRLNNAANSMGVPWRHSMSRDLGSDMDSMFSRTGATLPRGKISEHVGKPIASTADEPLDLADLDLSRLRLSKTDLETLSNIAPGLPKCFQEQLLAKLPPTQARKLSRTLSVQTSQNATRIYKRSQSSSRASTNQNCKTENVKEPEIVHEELKQEVAPSRHNINIARGEQECRDPTSSMGEDFTDKECCALYTSEINEKYKYYSPYVNKASRDANQLSGSTSTQKLAGSEIPSMLGRPPSGRLSPSTSAESTGSVAKRTSHRRISRLLRADMEHPLEESPVEKPMSREATDPTKELVGTVSKQKNPRHVRNKSMDAFSERGDNSPLPTDATKVNRRSLSRPRDVEDEQIGKHELADKILQELQLLSSMRSQQEQRESSVLRDVPSARSEAVGLPVVKKIKKIKISEKSTESSTEAETTVVKKVKKVIKKSDFTKTSTSDDIPGQMAEDVAKVLETGLGSPKKVSKLKRPKSYPMKDSAANDASSEVCTTLPATSCTSSDSKETTKHKGHAEAINSSASHSSCPLTRESRLLRPKSYPASKLNAPKELKKATRPSPPAGASLEEKPLFAKSDVSSSSTPNALLPDHKSQVVEAIPSTTLKKSIKVTKKSKLSQPTAVSSNSSTSNTTSSIGDDSKESSPAATIVQIKDKISEKKPGKGLLYAIGQKFEKLRASATSNSCANIPTVKKPPSDGSSPEKVSGKYSFVKKTKSLGSSVSKKATDVNKPDQCADSNQKEKKDPSEGRTAKGDKRSRIDVMIRNLRERSVPRSQPAVSTESNYIKHAVSVEEMPGTFNRKSVNKVLGLFKRYEKDTNNVNRVRNARSASNIQGQISEATPIYQNADAILKLKGKCGDAKYCSGERSHVCRGTVDCNCDLKSPVTNMPIISPCPECIEHVAANLYQDNKNAGEKNQSGNKDKRKGLMLELMKPERVKSVGENVDTMRSTKLYQHTNDNEIYSNLPPYPRPIPSLSSNSSTTQAADNLSNNNNMPLTNNNNSSSLNSSQTSGYRLASVYESNQNNNIASPSFDNIANYSSDSRSYQEDCASTSTFRSPTEEPELYFDNWSVCSEDNYRMHGATPSPTVSRLSRTSQVSSPTRRDGESSDPNESIVDRIRRRSFYCRFNEKKPKRTSSIVGPNAVREYYREQHAATKARSTNKLSTGERERSPDITQEFFRPLKLSPIGTELKPPVYKSAIGSTTHDYSTHTGRSRKSLSDIRTPPSPSGMTERRFGSFANADNDPLTHNSSILPTRYKSSTGAEPNKSSHTASYYSTYNPKRRFSYNINGSTPPSGSLASTSGHFEGYATMGRRPIRAYDHRTLSLLEPSSSSSYRHESNTPVRDYTTSLSRSNSRYRTTSASRSPTNI